MPVADLTRKPRPVARFVGALRAGIWVLLLPLLPLVAGTPARARALEPRQIDARVVWTRGTRAFVASLDPAALEGGARLTFRKGRDVVATGTIERVLEGGVALVRLDAGTLDDAGRPDRLTILALPPVLHVPSTLRIGLPSARRSNLVFDCRADAIAPPDPGWRIASDGTDARRMVRDSANADSPWPDTVIVRLFDDVADQEIALERGDLDIAVFWPGEPSAHLRASPFWDAARGGTRARGVIVSLVAPPDSGAARPAARTAPDFEALNRQLFRGDLDRAPGAPASYATDAAPGPDGPFVAVDAAMPGRTFIERFFNGRDRAAPGAGTAVTRLFYLDAIAAPDSIARAVARYVTRGSFPSALRARADSLLAGYPVPGVAEADASAWLAALGAAPRFTLRCPIACAPGLGAVVEALGTARLAGMPACRDDGASP